MIVPVVWVSYRQPSIINRFYWDQGLLERILDRRAWRPVNALGFEHHNGFDTLPDDAGAIVVLPAQHHHLPEEVDQLNADLARLPWVLLILTGDECSLFPWSKVEHPRMRMWVMTPRASLHATMPEGTTYIGEGCDDDVPDILATIGQRERHGWFFAGQVTHERRTSLAAGLRRMPRDSGRLVETPGFTKGLPRDEYLVAMAQSKVVPSPSGPCTPDSFRLYEALEAGCIPLADAIHPGGQPGFWEFVYGPVPFPVVDDWRSVRDDIDDALARWPALANRCSAWWQAEKRRLAYQLDDDVRDLANEYEPARWLTDRLTFIVSASPIPSHPSSATLNETLDSIIDAMPPGEDCEVIVCFDGVRAEQENRRADYEAHLHDALWAINHRRPNVVPLVFDEHLHQAEMTRRALAMVRTPHVCFVEHDTPLVGSIPWEDMADVLDSGAADVIRLHHEANVLEPHRYLMADETPQNLGSIGGSVPLLRTAQWSQRPHVARADWYRWMLGEYFGPSARTFIEDRLYGEIATPWVEWKEWGAVCKLWLYAPAGDMKRSTHLDGRGSDPKFEMHW